MVANIRGRQGDLSLEDLRINPPVARGVALQQEPLIENEVKYLLPFRAIERHIDVSKLDKLVVEQRYFNKGYLPAVWKQICKHSAEDLSEVSFESLKQARIRRTMVIERIDGKERLGDEKFELTVKGAKTGEYRNKRLEISLGITRNCYGKLMAFATEGYLSKFRFPTYGVTESGRAFKVEIDVLAEAGAGKNFRQYCSPDPSTWSRATVDCEVQCDRSLKEVVGGRHNIEFLKSSAILVSDVRELASTISNRRIAKNAPDLSHIDALYLQSA